MRPFLASMLILYTHSQCNRVPSSSVVFDTGSETLELASDECTSCAQKGKFVRSKSTTYCAGSSTSRLPFATGVGVDPAVNGLRSRRP